MNIEIGCLNCGSLDVREVDRRERHVENEPYQHLNPAGHAARVLVAATYQCNVCSAKRIVFLSVTDWKSGK